MTLFKSDEERQKECTTDGESYEEECERRAAEDAAAVADAEALAEAEYASGSECIFWAPLLKAAQIRYLAERD